MLALSMKGSVKWKDGVLRVVLRILCIIAHDPAILLLDITLSG